MRLNPRHLLLLALTGVGASSAHAAVVNVTASSASALRTAMAAARAGDTLILSGTYNLGTSGISTNADGTATNRITLMGGANGATLTGTTGGFGLGITHDYWSVQNLTINGFVKSIRIDSASHGTLDRITAINSSAESFKLRNTSQYWMITNSSATNAGAEGFYCGDADQNWVGGVPDRTGYVTFLNCTTLNTANDGFDNKEGTQDIKIVNSSVAWTTVIPGANDLGNSGIYNRATRLQAINFTVTGNASLGNAVRSHVLTALDGIPYGSGTDLYNLTATNLAGSLLYNRHPDTELYGYTMTSVAGGLLEPVSFTPAQPSPFTFTELTWDGIGGNRLLLRVIPEPSAAGLFLPTAYLVLRRRHH